MSPSFIVEPLESKIYLKATRNIQCHFLDVGGRERFQAFLSPLLYEVIEGLLSSILHGETLGSIFGRGKGTKTLIQANKESEFSYYS